MHAVGDVADRHFLLRPSRKEVLKNAPAHFAMQAADAVHRPRSPHRKISHVERLAFVIRVPAAEREQLRKGNAQLRFGVLLHVRLHQARAGTGRTQPRRAYGW